LAACQGRGAGDPCTFIGKHLRFSDDDIAQIMAEGARQPVTRGRSTRR
jgi:hypothetical protein